MALDKFFQQRFVTFLADDLDVPERVIQDHENSRQLVQHREHFGQLLVGVILFDESEVEKSSW